MMTRSVCRQEIGERTLVRKRHHFAKAGSILALVLSAACSNSPTAPSDTPGIGGSNVNATPVGSADVPAATASLATTTQFAVSQGQLIVQQAEKYVNGTIAERCNCKEFARRVVREASGGRVNLPPTSSNSYEWNLPAFGVEMFASVKPSSPRPIYGVDSGDLIQMVSRRTGLHTVVVKANLGSGMTFVEANYSSCRITSGRFVSFSAFLGEMSGWTVYRIRW